MVNDEDFIGQEQHHVALVFRPRQRQLDRVELESEIVTESAEQADGRIRIRIEEVDDGAQRGEDGWDFRTFFLSEDAVRLVDGEIEAACGGSAKREIGRRLQLSVMKPSSTSPRPL